MKNLFFILLILSSCSRRDMKDFDKIPCTIKEFEEKRKLSIHDEMNPTKWKVTTDCGFSFTTERKPELGDTVWIYKLKEKGSKLANENF